MCIGIIDAEDKQQSSITKTIDILGVKTTG